MFQKVLIYTNHTAKHHTVQPLQLPTKMFNKKKITFSSAEMKHTSMQFLNTNALMFFIPFVHHKSQLQIYYSHNYHELHYYDFHTFSHTVP